MKAKIVGMDKKLHKHLGHFTKGKVLNEGHNTLVRTSLLPTTTVASQVRTGQGSSGSSRPRSMARRYPVTLPGGK